MANVNKSLIGIAGVHHVVSELSRRGLIALPTVKNTAAYDIVAVNERGTKHANIQVKASYKRVTAFLMPAPEKIRTGDHDYFVLARWIERESRYQCFLLTGLRSVRAMGDGFAVRPRKAIGAAGRRRLGGAGRERRRLWRGQLLLLRPASRDSRSGRRSAGHQDHLRRRGTPARTGVAVAQRAMERDAAPAFLARARRAGRNRARCCCFSTVVFLTRGCHSHADQSCHRCRGPSGNAGCVSFPIQGGRVQRIEYACYAGQGA